MKKLSLSAVIGLALVASLSFGAGCKNTAEGVAEDTNKNVEATTDAMGKTGDKMAEGTDKMGKDAEKMGDKMKEGADKMGDKMEKGAKAIDLNVRVKTAIISSKKVPSTVDVDPAEGGKGVILRGTVKTEQQKKDAERIAKFTVGKGETVVNEIKVTP